MKDEAWVFISSFIFHLSSFHRMFDHEYWMRAALREAEKALELDEVPIGCVIVQDDHIVARGHNLTEQLKDATAHAEMMAITSASSTLESRYLTDVTLYVTIEP